MKENQAAAAAAIVLPVSEFRDCAIHVAPDCLGVYAQLRSEQLRMLADLLHCKAAGFEIKISDAAVFPLSGIVNQLATEVAAIADHYACIDPKSGKDGEA